MHELQNKHDFLTNYTWAKVAASYLLEHWITDTWKSAIFRRDKDAPVAGCQKLTISTDLRTDTFFIGWPLAPYTVYGYKVQYCFIVR